MKSSQTPKTEPVPFSRAILPSMQSTTKLRWNSSAPATSQRVVGLGEAGRRAEAQQEREHGEPVRRDPPVAGATSCTSRDASGSTSMTVHQASRDLYVRLRISSIVNGLRMLTSRAG